MGSTPAVYQAMKSLEEHSSGIVRARTRSGTSERKYLYLANIILTIAIVISFLFLFLLARERTSLKVRALEAEEKNRHLESELSLLYGSLSGPAVAQSGDITPPFEATNLDARKIVITHDGSVSRLLFIFSPECQVCVQEIPKWNRITQIAKASRYSVLGVSLKSADVTKSNLLGTKLDFEVAIMPSLAVQRAYRVVAEPVVMLVSPKGSVDWVHYGGLNERTVAELSSLIQRNGNQ